MKRLLLLSLLLLISNFTNAQGWGQTQKIVPDDRFQGQYFGADVDIDGDYAVVGVLVNNFAKDAYVYENDGAGNWIQLQKLESPDPHQFAHFGTAVAIDGDFIIIGSWGQHYDANETNYLQSAGAAYIFKKQASGLFEFHQKIVASDREALNAFGYGIALSGNYAVISPVRHDYDDQGANFLDDAGAAYIFEKEGTGTWNEVQKIVPSDRETFDYFGRNSVSIDGNFLVVSAIYEDEDENGGNELSSAGSAYIFERDGNGTWNEVQKIVASDRAQGELFGWSIGLDGNHLLVGSNQNNNFTGAAYVFEKDGNAIWNEVQKLTASNGVAGDRFGQDLDIDGNHIVVGADSKNFTVNGTTFPGIGAAYIFEKEAGLWVETAFIHDAFISSSEYFGFSVAISDDYALVGVYQDSTDENEENYLSNAGAAFIFNANEPNTLSVTENTSSKEFKAYPNPTNGKFTIDLKESYSKVHINIHNTLGQEVFAQKYHTVSKIDLDLDFDVGVYFITVSAENSQAVTLKVIKQ